MTSRLVGQHSTHCATIPALSSKDWWLPVGQMNEWRSKRQNGGNCLFSFFVMSRRFLPSHDNKWEIKKFATRGITARKLFPTSMPIMMGVSVDWLTIRLDMFGHHHLFEHYWLICLLHFFRPLACLRLDDEEIWTRGSRVRAPTLPFCFLTLFPLPKKFYVSKASSRIDLIRW